jgi:hypothetical protein
VGRREVHSCWNDWTLETWCVDPDLDNGQQLLAVFYADVALIGAAAAGTVLTFVTSGVGGPAGLVWAFAMFTTRGPGVGSVQDPSTPAA